MGSRIPTLKIFLFLPQQSSPAVPHPGLFLVVHRQDSKLFGICYPSHHRTSMAQDRFKGGTGRRAVAHTRPTLTWGTAPEAGENLQCRGTHSQIRAEAKNSSVSGAFRQDLSNHVKILHPGQLHNVVIYICPSM